MTSSNVLAANIITFQTLTPVHIGTGDIAGGLDFAIQDGCVYFLNENKLLQWLSANPRISDNFILHSESGQPISGFLKQYGKNAAQLADYKLVLPTNNALRDIRLCFKDFKHQPYLPGSSIKGSLRSSLLRGFLLSDEDAREQANAKVDTSIDNYLKTRRNDRAKPRETGSSEIEANVFVKADIQRVKRPNYDINRALLVRDSLPLPVESLGLFETSILTLQKQGSNLQLANKKFTIFVEGIKQWVKGSIHISWQTHLFEDAGAEDELKFSKRQSLMMYLPEFCRAASLNILQQEIDFYHLGGNRDLAGWCETQRDNLANSADMIFMLPVGWGSGYDAKTITDLLDEAVFGDAVENYPNISGLGKPGRNKNAKWMGADKSPKSRKVWYKDGQKSPLPLGWIKFAINSPEDDMGQWMLRQREELSSEKPIFNLPSKPRSDAIAETPTLESPAIEDIAAPKGEAMSSSGSQSSREAPKPKPVKKAPIADFEITPKVGDVFKGEVFDFDNDVLLTIPGLEDTVAYAVIARASIPSFMRIKEGQLLLCEVQSIELEFSKTDRVICTLYE